MLNPSSPSSSRREQKLVLSGPRRLLSLVRAVERGGGGGGDDVTAVDGDVGDRVVPQPSHPQQWCEILDELSDVRASLARGGIAAVVCGDGDRSPSRNKRMRRPTGDKSPAAGNGEDDECDGGDVSPEGRLWLTALTRTLSLGLGDGDGQRGSPSTKGERQRVRRCPPPPAVVEAASDAITALCEHTRCHRRTVGTLASGDQVPVFGDSKRKRKRQKKQQQRTTTITKEGDVGDDDELDLVAEFAPRWFPSLADHAERCLSLLDGGGRGERRHHFGIPYDVVEPPPRVGMPLTSTGDDSAEAAGWERIADADADAAADCAASCMRACSSLVTLLGTGLSRAGGGGGRGGGKSSSGSGGPSLLTRLNGLAWAAMGSYYHRLLPPASSGGGRRRRPNEASDSTSSLVRWHPKVMRAGAVLASSLPLLGCTDDGPGVSGHSRRRFAPPSELWSEALRSTLESLDLTVRSAWSSGSASPPLYPSAVSVAVDAGDRGTADLWWLRGMRSSVTDQDDRAAAVLCRTSALTALATSLLNMEGYPAGGQGLHVRLPLGKALDVCEVLVGFPAGIRFASSSPRRRGRGGRGGGGDATVSAEGSLMSPFGASSISVPVRCAGHDLFQAVAMTASLGCNALTPHGRAVVGLVDRSMTSSSSPAVRRSVVVSTTTRRRRRSSSSSPQDDEPGGDAVVRRKAMRSVRVALLALGSAAAPLLGRSALLVAGCLLETLVPGDCYDGGDYRDRYTTVGERVELATEAMETLSAFFTVGGSFLPLPCRTTLEGVLVSTLRSVEGTASASMAAGFSQTKVALLRLATDAVCSPWNDGGTGGGGTLITKLRDVSSALRRDRDHAVAAAARSATCVCDALYVPRAPPLHVVRCRSSEGMDGSDGAAAGIGLLDSIETAGREASEAVESKASRIRSIGDEDAKASIDEEQVPNGERATAQLQHPVNLAPAHPSEGNETNAESAESHRIATGESASVDPDDDGGSKESDTVRDEAEGATTIEASAEPIETNEGNGKNESAGKSDQKTEGVGLDDSSPVADRERRTTDPPPESRDSGIENVTAPRAVAHLKVDATTNAGELGTTGDEFHPTIGGSESSESDEDDLPPIVDCGPDEEDLR